VLLGCLPVAGDPWQSYTGAAGWTRNAIETNSIRALYEEGEEDAIAAVRSAESLGKRVTLATQVIKSGGQARRDLLVEDGGYRSFLDRLT
jgi:hypothetical protein